MRRRHHVPVAAVAAIAGPALALGFVSDVGAAPAGVPTTIRVATFVNDPPNTLPGPGGTLTGFDPQLVAAATRTQGISVKWVRIRSFAGILSGVADARVDMAAAAITITPRRRQSLLFGTPVTSGNQGILAPAGSGISSTEDLRGKRVAAIPNSTAETTVRAIPGAIIVPQRSPAGVARAVAAGTVAAGVGDLSACNWAATHDPSLAVAATITRNQVAAWAYPPTAAGRRLRAAMNRGIAATKRDGTYDRLVARWGVAAP